MAKKKRSIKIPMQLFNRCPACDHNMGFNCRPSGPEAVERIKEFLLYQVLEVTLTGTKKARSIKQLNLYWACCALVAELLSDHNNILDRNDIDFEIKIRAAKKRPALIRRFKVVGGMVYMEPISTSFDNMKHLEACKYYDVAFSMMGNMVDKDVDILISEAKARMK